MKKKTSAYTGVLLFSLDRKTAKVLRRRGTKYQLTMDNYA